MGGKILVTICVALFSIGGILFNVVFAEENTIESFPKEYDVIVIGAGISGLAAADALQQMEYDVLVLEARDRIGGRLWTVETDAGPLDLGASWIHGIKYNPIFSLAQKYNITMVPTLSESDPHSHVFFKDGKKLSHEEAKQFERVYNEFIEYVYEKYSYIPKHPITAVTWDKFFEYKKFSEKTINDVLEEYLNTLDNETRTEYRDIFESLAVYEYTNTWAADTNQISARHYDIEITYPYPEVIFPKGYNQISDNLKKDLDILTNHIVTEIKYTDGGIIDLKKDSNIVYVDATNSTGHVNKLEFKSKYVLSTVPLGVLKDSVLKEQKLDSKKGIINFEPDLPKKKIDAINKVGMGVLNKAYLIFNEAGPNNDVFWIDDNENQWIAVLKEEQETEWALFLNLYKFLGKPALLAFNSGSYGESLENYTDEEIKIKALENLEILYPGKVPNPEDVTIIVTRWASDDFTRGSYSYPAAGSTPEDYHTLAESVNERLFFAGEATIPEAWGTVHGGYLSGIRAAEEIDYWYGWHKEHQYSLIIIIGIFVSVVASWIWYIRQRRIEDTTLLILGKEKQTTMISTLLIVFTGFFFLTSYYFFDSEMEVIPDLFEHTSLPDDNCFHLSQLIDALPYIGLNLEQENVYYQQLSRCNG